MEKPPTTHELGQALPNTLYVVGGESHPRFTEAIVREIPGLEQGNVQLRTFSDSEIFTKYDESVRGADVFIVQSHGKSGGRSINDSIMQQGLMVQAAKKASAKRVTAVAPYLGYCRSDKKDEPRQAIGAKFVAQLLEMAGADRIMSMDLHSPQIQGFVDIPYDHLMSENVLVEGIRDIWMKDKDPSEVRVVSPDAGRAKTNEKFAELLGVDMALIRKRRSKDSTVVEALELVGDVEGKDCIVIDDIIDTAGTLKVTGSKLISLGARSIAAAAAHPVLSGDAAVNIENSDYEMIIATDTLPTRKIQGVLGDRLRIVTAAPYFGQAILAVYMNKSVSVVSSEV